jgi:hypothetical protein
VLCTPGLNEGPLLLTPELSGPVFPLPVTVLPAVPVVLVEVVTPLELLEVELEIVQPGQEMPNGSPEVPRAEPIRSERAPALTRSSCASLSNAPLDELVFAAAEEGCAPLTSVRTQKALTTSNVCFILFPENEQAYFILIF